MTDEAKRALEKLRALGFTNEEGAIEWALNLLLVVEKLPPGCGLTVGKTGGENDCYFAEVRHTNAELEHGSPGSPTRHFNFSDDADTAAEVALLDFQKRPPLYPAFSGRGLLNLCKPPPVIPAGDVLGELPDVD